jgi:hypothetical protein
MLYPMPQTKVVTRLCPHCGASIELPLIYSYDTEIGADPRLEIGQHRGCPNAFQPGHPKMGDADYLALV